MRLASPAGRRLSTLGCVLVGMATLTLSACGNDGAATAGSTVASPSKQQTGTPAAPGICPARVGAFVRSLDRLRNQLAVGLSYDQYAARMKSLRASYDAITVDRLSIGCLARTGTPAEDALNEYVDATNAWGECLADAACTTASIEPVLQGKWRTASRFLSEAE